MHFKSIVAVIWNCHLFKIHIINNLNNITHCIFWSLLSFHDDEGDKFTSYSENTNNQKFYLDQVINFIRKYSKGSMKIIAFSFFTILASPFSNLGEIILASINTCPQSLSTLVTHSLMLCRLDWCDLACENADSKLVEVVTVADVDAEIYFDNSLVEIWMLKFGHKAEFLSRLCAQSLVKILKFGWYLEVDAWSWFWIWNLIKICLRTCDAT